MRFYRFKETSYAQIQAVGVSLQIGATIVGIAPERWFQPGGRDRRKPRLFSRLAIHIFADDYGNGVRTAFGICLGTIRAEFKTKGIYRDQPTSEPLGWQFWRYHSPAT